MTRRFTPRIAVVGGGLAGLAVAAALAEEGLDVELYEQRATLGGRAGSLRDPQVHEWIDYCPHVWMGCSTNLADFCRRTEVSDCFRRDQRIWFVGPEGEECELAGSRWLGAPLNLLPALARLHFLTWPQRREIGRGLWQLMRQSPQEETFGPWLRRQGQSDRSIERFWSVVTVSALSEHVDRVSLAAARQVFCEGFLGSKRASDLYVPQRPLAEIFDSQVAQRLERLGARLHRGTRVQSVQGRPRRAEALVMPGGSQRAFDFFVIAVPWRQVRRVLPTATFDNLPILDQAQNLAHSPITTVHLWFDRPITRLPHAALVGRLSQWVFRAPIAGRTESALAGEHYQVVISASHALAGRPRKDIAAEVCNDLAAVWPEAREARLVHWRVTTQPAAVFSMAPGADRVRPGQRTPVENLFLAGDWTATGWPATMEGAVRSGYLAAEGILGALGMDRRILVPDLPREWLARRLIRV